MQADLVGVTEAAAILEVSVKSVHRYVERGWLTPIHKLPGLRGAVIFNRADVEALALELETA
jgi:hypothetical protein